MGSVWRSPEGYLRPKPGSWEGGHSQGSIGKTRFIFDYPLQKGFWCDLVPLINVLHATTWRSGSRELERRGYVEQKFFV
jgi:hypothetical protein